MEEHAHHIEHPDMYDAESSKVGMWLFIFTELLLFGGLFLVYTVYRYMNPDAFHLAADHNQIVFVILWVHENLGDNFFYFLRSGCILIYFVYNDYGFQSKIK